MNLVKVSSIAVGLAFGWGALAKPVTAVLQLHAQISMEELAREVSDPNSPRYQRYFSPQEIRDLAGPNEAEYQSTLQQLREQGFKIESESATKLSLTVSGDSATFENVFATKLAHRADGRHQMLKRASVPASLSLVESVVGLDSTRQAHPKFHRAHAGPFDGVNDGIPQATIKTAYGFDPLYTQGLSGLGVHIAIATYDGFYAADVQKFYSDSALQPGPVLDQVMFNGTPTYNENSAGETQLDSEFSGMIAPGASIHVFASATNDDAGESGMFTAILDDNRAKIVNYSWGSCETNVSQEHQADMTKILARAAAQGVNIFVASGDTGSDSCGDGTLAADFPSSNPNVVAVGGTTFQEQNGVIAETAWSCSSSVNQCSGGGISALYDLPTYQNNMGLTRRTYPDVAFNADYVNSGQAIYAHNGGQAGYLVVGGTSMAAPQWAGFMALVQQARTLASKQPLGALNPSLYQMSSADRAKAFHDVTVGNNGAYQAAVGFDPVTGFGSMNAANLLGFLNAL